MHRSQVGKERQFFPQLEQAILGADLSQGVVPPGTAHRAEQDGIGFFTSFYRRSGDGCTLGVYRRPADKAVIQAERMPVFPADRLQYLNAFGNDLRADAIAGQYH